MTRRARVLVCGHACLDLITRLPRSPGPDEKVEALDHWLGGGGPAANAAVALARLGHDVELLAQVGDDAAGALLRREIDSEAIRWGCDPVVGGTSSVAAIRAVGASRSVAWRRGALPPLRLRPQQSSELLAGRDLLYLDGHEPEAALGLVQEAQRMGVPVVADLGSCRPGAEEIVRASAWVAVTVRFLEGYRGSPDPQMGLDALASTVGAEVPVAVTLGERGCLVRWQGRRERIAARQVDVVDSTAAGDAFHAGLADAVLGELSPPEAVGWASTLAAAVCRELGGRRGLPRDRAEAEGWWRSWPTRPD